MFGWTSKYGLKSTSYKNYGQLQYDKYEVHSDEESFKKWEEDYKIKIH